MATSETTTPAEFDDAATPRTTDDVIDLIEREVKDSKTIPVRLSYEIIRLFSEGLYQSPHKAVEELVSNSYDAEARNVFVLLPEGQDVAPPNGNAADDESGPAKDEQYIPLQPLWVVDNGSGLSAQGFEDLWRVADSPKKNTLHVAPGKRLPVGQFGIGKLAAYVLAWRLTHVSKAEGVIRMTSMNFRRLDTVHQYDNANPVDLAMRELTDEQARRLLAPIESRDPEAFAILFGPTASSSWTVAALSDFKNLYEKLSTGRLGWVLSTGIPLHSQFKIRLNGQTLASSKETLEPLLKYAIGGVSDSIATSLGLKSTKKGIVVPGIDGEISGSALIVKKRLTEGKSDQYHRSHGFFVRVRGRIINLEDELFGLDALNHAAWARFSMTVTADGLREHLLSSREGVRESDPIRLLRQYMHQVFNVCRKAYDDWMKSQSGEDDVSSLLRN